MGKSARLYMRRPPQGTESCAGEKVKAMALLYEQRLKQRHAHLTKHVRPFQTSTRWKTRNQSNSGMQTHTGSALRQEGSSSEFAQLSCDCGIAASLSPSSS